MNDTGGTPWGSKNSTALEAVGRAVGTCWLQSMTVLHEASVWEISNYLLAKQKIDVRMICTCGDLKWAGSKRPGAMKSANHNTCLAVNGKYFHQQYTRFADNWRGLIKETAPPSATMVQVLCTCSRCSTKTVKTNNIVQPGQLVHPTTRLDHEKHDKHPTSSKPKHQPRRSAPSENTKKESPTKGI